MVRIYHKNKGGQQESEWIFFYFAFKNKSSILWLEGHSSDLSDLTGLTRGAKVISGDELFNVAVQK